MAVIEKQKVMLDSFQKDSAADWDNHAQPQLDLLQQFVITVLLGTNTVTFPEQHLQDFIWHCITVANSGQPQIILRVGSEGGELMLVGIQSGKTWRYCVTRDESTLYSLMEEDQPAEVDAAQWTSVWRNAMKQLDQYPWTELYPLAVHADFRERIVKALKVKEKKMPVDWQRWCRVLQIDEEQ